MKPHTMSRWARICSIAALVPALAWAQEGPESRRAYVDPEVPADQTAGTGLHAWSLLNVTGLPEGSSLGSLWVGANDDVYVWASRTVISIPLHTSSTGLVLPEDPPAPDGAPRANYVVNSTLLRWDGTAWNAVLDRPAETAVSVFGVSRNDVYAATTAVNGTVRLYHYNGHQWRLERLPDGIAGPAGAIVGDRTRVFFRAGNAILRGTGRHWTVAYVNDELAPGGELVFLGRDQILAPACMGQAHWDGMSWEWMPNAIGMDMGGAWGRRDEAGELHLFGTGSDLERSGMCIWQYVEGTPWTLHGTYQEVVEEPDNGRPNTGRGIDMWGSGVHDVYAVGAILGHGCLMRFNGIGWSEIFPMNGMTTPSSIFGTAEGDLWIALRDGRVLFGARREPLVLEPSPRAPSVFDRMATGVAVVRREAARSFVLEYRLPEARDVTIGIYDVVGRRVAMLDRGQREAGTHLVRWNAAGARAGMYFCRVQAGDRTDVARLMIDR